MVRPLGKEQEGRPKRACLQVEVAIFPEVDLASLDPQSREAVRDSNFGITEGNVRETKH